MIVNNWYCGDGSYILKSLACVCVDWAVQCYVGVLECVAHILQFDIRTIFILTHGQAGHFIDSSDLTAAAGNDHPDNMLQ